MNAETVFKLLQEALQLFMNGDQAGFDACMHKARALIGDGADEEALLGEWMLLNAFSNVRDLDAFAHELDAAIPCMRGCRSRIVTPESTGGFANESALWTVLHQPGTADAQEKRFRYAMERYNILTGCGCGYPEFYRAEVAYQRGDLMNAHVLAYQAVYLAQNTKQKRLVIAAAKQIGYIAAHFQNIQDWAFAIHTMQDIFQESGNLTVPMDPLRGTANLIKNELLVLLGDFDSLPEWMLSGRIGLFPGEGTFGLKGRVDDPNISFFDYPLALWVHALYLMRTGQASRMLAVDAVQRVFGVEESLLCYRIYYALLRGVGYLALGDRSRAQEEFDLAVDLIVPDGFWLTIGMFLHASDGMILDSVKRKGGDVAAVQRIGRGYCDNAKKLREAVAERNTDRLLTTREREVAHLVAKGMRNREVSEQLSVTEQTVKFHLSNIYAKLAIDNRAKLVSLIKNTP